MIEPPNPHFPAALLVVAANLGFIVLAATSDGTEIGTFVDQSGALLYLVVANEGPIGSCAWALVSTVPPGFAGYLVTRATYGVLQDGAPADDGRGAVVYQGTAYGIQSLWNDPGHEARAVAT